MLNSSLSGYRNKYILVKGTIILIDQERILVKLKQMREIGNLEKLFFSHCMSEINKAQVDNAIYLDAVFLMYDLVEYSNNYSKTLRKLWQFCRVKANATITDFELFKFKAKLRGKTPDAGNTEDVEIVCFFLSSNF